MAASVRLQRMDAKYMMTKMSLLAVMANCVFAVPVNIAKATYLQDYPMAKCLDVSNSRCVNPDRSSSSFYSDAVARYGSTIYEAPYTYYSMLMRRILCSQGTPAFYYMRKAAPGSANASKFVIHIQGGEDEHTMMALGAGALWTPC